MKNCSVNNCPYPSFGKDKKTGIPYCSIHQHLRTDIDRRSPLEKHLAKSKDNGKVRKLISEDGSLQYLINDLDAIFSRYIRIKYADDRGIVKCFTCPKEMHWSLIQNGHYTSRKHLGFRFSEANCRPQCEWCNSKHNNDTTAYTEALEREQNGVTEWLTEASREVYKPSQDELKGMILDYRMKLKLVEGKLRK